MTNTYDDKAPYDVKLLEEIRCLRCVNERILRVMDEGLFTDYQMEKFSGNSSSRSIARKIKDEDSIFIPKKLRLPINRNITRKKINRGD